MRVSYNWLKEYVDVPWSVEELAEKLTIAGLEVEELEKLAPDLDNVYVGEIKKVHPHPNANLSVCDVAVGDEDLLNIVCGAPNTKEGLKTAVAVEGAILPNGTKIKPTEIRGVKSLGMICSEKELGIGEDVSGIMDLPSEIKTGDPLVAALGLNDYILDIYVYANRPDCMSMLGIAREVAALCETNLKYPEVNVKEQGKPIEDMTSIEVLDKEKCPRYSARLINNIELKPSPLWMQNRLRAAGMRPINNIVDITNFVMLETGQPLHAFDYDKLAGNRIVVRTAEPDETLITLDGQKRNLSSEMLMICDAEKPVCIGGVMGGENSEVSDTTSSILLESANFSGVNIRRTAKSLGIASEAASRFEKDLDPFGTLRALNRAAELFAKYADGEVAKGIIDVGKQLAKDTILHLRPNNVNNLLGTDISAKDMIRILNSLELKVDTDKTPWEIKIPSFRRDIELEADLIEEVARLWGFDKIPVTLPRGRGIAGGQNYSQQVIDEIRDLLIGAGLYEGITYSFVHPRSIEQIELANSEPWSKMIPLQNPITEEFSRMRTTLIPGLLDSVSRNVSRQKERVALFEIGLVYLTDVLPLTEQPCEEQRLGIVLTGPRNEVHWKTKLDNYDFYDIKGITEDILDLFSAEFNWARAEFEPLHPGRQGEVSVNNKVIARFGEIHPKIQQKYKIPTKTYILELDLEALLNYPRKLSQFSPLPKYPSVERDMALLLDVDVPVQNVRDALQQAGGDIVKKITVFDVYEGEQVAKDKKSVAFSFVFQEDRTLTDKEVNKVFDNMYSAVKQDYGAEIR